MHGEQLTRSAVLRTAPLDFWRTMIHTNVRIEALESPAFSVGNDNGAVRTPEALVSKISGYGNNIPFSRTGEVRAGFLLVYIEN